MIIQTYLNEAKRIEFCAYLQYKTMTILTIKCYTRNLQLIQLSYSMAIPIAILDCDLLLHGRGHKTLDRFELDSVPDNLLLSQFGFPREFILYLVELLREVSVCPCSVLNNLI